MPKVGQPDCDEIPVVNLTRSQYLHDRQGWRQAADTEGYDLYIRDSKGALIDTYFSQFYREQATRCPK